MKGWSLLLLAFVAWLLGCTYVQGATLGPGGVYSDGVATQNTDFPGCVYCAAASSASPETVTVRKFDSTLGTLTSVTLTMSAAITTSITVTNSNTGSTADFDVTTTAYQWADVPKTQFYAVTSSTPHSLTGTAAFVGSTATFAATTDSISLTDAQVLPDAFQVSFDYTMTSINPDAIFFRLVDSTGASVLAIMSDGTDFIVRTDPSGTNDFDTGAIVDASGTVVLDFYLVKSGGVTNGAFTFSTAGNIISTYTDTSSGGVNGGFTLGTSTNKPEIGGGLIGTMSNIIFKQSVIELDYYANYDFGSTLPYNIITSPHYQVTVAAKTGGIDGTATSSALTASHTGTKTFTTQRVLDLFTAAGTGDITLNVFAVAYAEGTYNHGSASTSEATTANADVSVTYTYTAASGAVGDPQFTGYQGQSFQFHGIPNEYFTVLSTRDSTINARFTYIDASHPTHTHSTADDDDDGEKKMNGCLYPNFTMCYSHPGTYMSVMGYVIHGHRIKAVAGSAAQGMRVWINDEPLLPLHPTSNPLALHTIPVSPSPPSTTATTADALNARISLDSSSSSTSTSTTTSTSTSTHSTSTLTNSPSAACYLEFVQAHTLSLVCERYMFVIRNSQRFFNIESGLTDREMVHLGSTKTYLTQAQTHDQDYVLQHMLTHYDYERYAMHGLLGQTYMNIHYAHHQLYQGRPSDYQVPDLFSTSFDHSPK